MAGKPNSSKLVRCGQPKFESTMSKWIEDASDVEHVDENFVIESDHDTASEISGSEIEDDVEEYEDSEQPEEDESENRRESYYGKNRFKWSRQEPATFLVDNRET